MAEIKMTLQEITLAKALKVKYRLAKVQADQINVPALMQTREELVGALVSLKTAINDANGEAQLTPDRGRSPCPGSSLHRVSGQTPFASTHS
jgi:hypothetical protein